jgi:nucleotide-binding universal stress UspA family protein
MTSLARILAATDFSAPARHAVQRAFFLAAEHDAQLELIHVLQRGALETLRAMLAQDAGRVEAQLLELAHRTLQGLATEMAQMHAVQATLHVVCGHLITAILEQAEARQADLLVVGARGEGFLSHLLLGSTAERLLRRTSRPVLVVRQVPHETYRRVLVPVDFSPWSLPALQLARAVAPAGEIVLLHAFEAPFEPKLQYAGVDVDTIERYRTTMALEARGRLHALAEEAGLSLAQTHLVVLHGDPSRIILTQEQEWDCDLVVLGKHGQGVLEELLLGSVTKHVLAGSAGDVLVATARQMT